MLLCDTGVLLAAGNVKDHHHAACLSLMRPAEGPLLVPSPVLGEIGYLLQSRVGPHAEVTFLRSFGGNGFHVVRRAVRTGTEKLTRDLLDHVRNAAAEAARQELLAAFDAGSPPGPPRPGRKPWHPPARAVHAGHPDPPAPAARRGARQLAGAYAHLLHVTVRDIFAFARLDWDRVNGDQRTSKPWLHQLDKPDLIALSAVTAVPAATLAGMTLARYQGTGLPKRPPCPACGATIADIMLHDRGPGSRRPHGLREGGWSRGLLVTGPVAGGG